MRIQCDKCIAEAKFEAKGLAGSLFFCGHHFHEFADALDKWSYEIVDLTAQKEKEMAEVTNGSTD